MSRPKYQGVYPRRSASIQEKLEWYSMPEPNSGCRLWLGAVDDGYGRLGRDRAHRVAWRERHGPIPPGMKVCHKCDVRSCIEDNHLFLGTHTDNMADMVAKGRCPGYRGEDHPQAKLTNAQRAAIASDARPQSAIARDYGISQSMVSMLKSGARKVL